MLSKHRLEKDQAEEHKWHPVFISMFNKDSRDLWWNFHSTKVSMTMCMIQHTKTKQNFFFKCKTFKAKQITVISLCDLRVNLSFKLNTWHDFTWVPQGGT